MRRHKPNLLEVTQKSLCQHQAACVPCLPLWLPGREVPLWVGLDHHLLRDCCFCVCFSSVLSHRCCAAVPPMQSALRFTSSSSPLLLLGTLIRPLFFRDSSSIFRVLISSNKACFKLKSSSSVLPLRELLSHVLHVRSSTIVRIVSSCILSFGRILFHNLFSVCLQAVRTLSKSLALVAWGGNRAFNETIGVAIATLVSHFPHQLHHFFMVGLEHTRVELALGVSSQGFCVELSDFSLMGL